MEKMQKLESVIKDVSQVKGDFFYYNKGILVSPQVVDSINYSGVRVLTTQYQDGIFLNGRLVAVIYEAPFYKVIFNTSVIDIGLFNGICVFGDKVFCFYENKCLVLDTISGEIKTVNITAPSPIVHAYQISPYLFALITSPPTTIYIYSLVDAGNIANTVNGGSITLPSYSYATFSHPKTNIKLVRRNNYLYLTGDGATVELDLDVKDLVYLRTVQSFSHKVNPFYDLELQGLDFIRETLNFYLFYNTLNNSYLWISKGDGSYFFSTNTIYLTNEYALSFGDAVDSSKVYKFSHIFSTALNDIPIERTFFVKFKREGLGGIYINFKETTSLTVGMMSVLSRFLQATSYYAYTLHANRNYYKTSLKGEEFIIGINTNHAVRMEEPKVW